MQNQNETRKTEGRLETMNKKTLWDLKAKDVNLKDVKTRSLSSERRGSQRSNKK